MVRLKYWVDEQVYHMYNSFARDYRRVVLTMYLNVYVEPDGPTDMYLRLCLSDLRRTRSVARIDVS